jgi:preprotein translocase subunit SecB
MTDETTGTGATIDAPLANGEDTSPAIGMIAQYVKDLSFESPNSPGVFSSQVPQETPQMDVEFGIATAQVGDEFHEVTLKVEVRAKTGDQTAFLIDLTYAGLFGARNVPEEHLQPFLLAQAPTLLFPFARRVIADVTRDGNFTPLLLDPLDFGALYQQQLEAQQAQAEGAPGNA